MLGQKLGKTKRDTRKNRLCRMIKEEWKEEGIVETCGAGKYKREGGGQDAGTGRGLAESEKGCCRDNLGSRWRREGTNRRI